MQIEVFHGTASSFERFEMRPSGLHFGTFDQAVHAATLKLARLPLRLFETLAPDASGWAGRIIQARLDFTNMVRVPDARTPSAWASVIKREQAKGADCLVYSNNYEGREPKDSFVVFNTDCVAILNSDYTRPSQKRSNGECHVRHATGQAFGRIVALTDADVVQDAGRGRLVAWERKALQTQELEVGEMVTITDKGAVTRHSQATALDLRR